MAASVVAVTLYTVALLVFGLGYAVVFFTGKVCYNTSKSWATRLRENIVPRVLPSNVPPLGGICSSGYYSKTPNLRLNRLSTAGKITSARHTKIFYLAAAATLAWFITDIADTSLSLFADFAVEIDTTGLIYLTQVTNSLTKKTSIISVYFIQGLSYFIAFVLAFRLNSQCDSKKVWLLLLIPVAVTAVVIGLELTMEMRCKNIGEILWQLFNRMTTMFQ